MWQALAQNLSVSQRGGTWLLCESQAQAQWQVSSGPGSRFVDGPGLATPLAISPAVLARLRPGSEIDRDPITGFVLRVAVADQGSVTLQNDGPDRTIMYAYDRSTGLMVRSSSRQRGANANQFIVREMQLAGKR